MRRAPWPSEDLLASLRNDLAGRSSDLALVLGSGLGGMAEELEDSWVRAAAEIPGYPASTVPGHRGRLLLGRLRGREIWIVQGRVHLYEGYTPEEVTRYVRLLHALGVRRLLLTNAAGSVDHRVGPGEIVAAEDALNLFFRSFLIPAAETSPGAPGGAPAVPAGERDPFWRRRDRLADPHLWRLAFETARDEGIPLRAGILLGSMGPSYETAAEVQAWRRLGGSVVSMSTVPEALVARELGIRCLLLSLVTNLATGLSPGALSHEDVVERAGVAGARLAALVRALVARLGTGDAKDEKIA